MSDDDAVSLTPIDIDSLPRRRGADAREDKPGRRLNNPLANLASYTYEISLYMITPAGYDAFMASGRKNINSLPGGIFLIARSGGINNSSGEISRAPGFELDYYIDDLEIKTLTSGRASMSATNSTEFKFKITEPHGFSFITQLKRASDALRKDETQWPQNSSRQFFILGLKFYGYDQAGNLVRGSSVFDGQPLDATSSGPGLFETFFDIIVRSIKFKLDGKSTVYDIEAVSVSPGSAFGKKRGFVTKNKTFENKTVGEAIRKLLDSLNQDEQQKLDAGRISEKNEYDVVFLDDAGEKIDNATIVSQADLDKNKWPGSGARNTDESNPALETTTSTPNNNKRTVSINQGTPIIQAIDNIIAQSSYMENALKTVYTTKAKNSENQEEKVEISSGNTGAKISWFNCSAIISNAKFDKKRGDWSYKITYVIQTYETPVVDSPYIESARQYYGPHKRYNYYFTGENKEILNYEQSVNNAYFNIVLDPSQRPLTDKSEATVPKIDIGHTNGDRSSRTGVGLEAQNSYRTSLYDPSAFASAKIEILGDPDFLIHDSLAGDVQEVYNRFYGNNGFRVNANGGQVFIEIDFKEAIDYSAKKGTMQINDSILFWRYPENIAKQIKGISYMLTEVQSSFSKGTFKQQLNCIVSDFPDPVNREAQREEQDTDQSETTLPPGGTSSLPGPQQGIDDDAGQTE